MKKISDLHTAARELAASGLPIFPCVPGGKDPASKNGFHDATTDLVQIDAWWTAQPNFNPAFSPHQVGWGIVDIDGPEGEAAWAELNKQECIPLTYEVRTPRNGRHLYFQGDLPMTAWRPGGKRNLGKHLDTRGVGSYVLAPPSIITNYTGAEARFNGNRYEVLIDRPLADVPRAFQERLAKRDVEAVTAVEARDLPGNVDRGRLHIASLLRRGDVAVSGSAGNNRTYQLTCELLNLGISPAVCRELLEPWNDRCLPPWEDGELTAIIENAANYAQNEVGAWGVPPAEEVFTSVLDKLGELPPEQPEARSRFYFEDEAEQDTAKNTSWMIPQLVPDASTILIVGPKGNFKSFIAHELTLAIAANQTTFGTMPQRPGPTFYATHEGANDLKRGRRQAWRIAREIDRQIPIYVAPAPHVASAEEVLEWKEQLRTRLRQSPAKISCIVLDTVAKCMVGLDENSAADMGQFVAFCDNLVFEFECPVIALHHTKKDGTKGSRGSGALEAGFSTVLDVERAGKSKLVSVSVRYHKDAEEPEKPWHFEGRVVGSSLVFSPIAAADFKGATMDNDPFDKHKVGGALQILGAIGAEEAVSTTVLATYLTPGGEQDAPGVRDEAVKKAARILNALARTKLAAYCTGDHKNRMWWLPTPEAEKPADIPD